MGSMGRGKSPFRPSQARPRRRSRVSQEKYTNALCRCQPAGRGSWGSSGGSRKAPAPKRGPHHGADEPGPPAVQAAAPNRAKRRTSSMPTYRAACRWARPSAGGATAAPGAGRPAPGRRGSQGGQGEPVPPVYRQQTPSRTTRHPAKPPKQAAPRRPSGTKTGRRVREATMASAARTIQNQVRLWPAMRFPSRHPPVRAP